MANDPVSHNHQFHMSQPPVVSLIPTCESVVEQLNSDLLSIRAGHHRVHLGVQHRGTALHHLRTREEPGTSACATFSRRPVSPTRPGAETRSQLPSFINQH